MLVKSAATVKQDWDRRLPYVLFAYRTSPQESTGQSPFALLYGREAVLPTEEVLRPPVDRATVTIETYAEEVAAHLKEA